MEIKDSGERREFPSGAVRDMQEGKGRFDLLPWGVIWRLAKHYEAGAHKYEENNWKRGIDSKSYFDSAIRHLVKYEQGWDDEDHLAAALWNICGICWNEEHRPDLNLPERVPF